MWVRNPTTTKWLVLANKKSFAVQFLKANALSLVYNRVMNHFCTDKCKQSGLIFANSCLLKFIKRTYVRHLAHSLVRRTCREIHYTYLPFIYGVLSEKETYHIWIFLSSVRISWWVHSFSNIIIHSFAFSFPLNFSRTNDFCMDGRKVDFLLFFYLKMCFVSCSKIL